MTIVKILPSQQPLASTSGPEAPSSESTSCGVAETHSMKTLATNTNTITSNPVSTYEESLSPTLRYPESAFSVNSETSTRVSTNAFSLPFSKLDLIKETAPPPLSQPCVSRARMQLSGVLSLLKSWTLAIWNLICSVGIAARAVAASGIGIPFFFIVALVGTVLVFAGRWFIGFTLVGISFIGIPSSVLLVKLLRKPERSTSWR